MQRTFLRSNYWPSLCVTAALTFALILGLTPKGDALASTKREHKQPQDPTNANIPELKLGVPIEQELAAGQTHSYKIALSSGQYVNVTVEQFGVNAEVVLFDPKGTQIISLDWWWREGTESLWAAAESTGIYTLKITSPAHPVETGKYRVAIKRIHEWQHATPSEQSSVKAFQNFAEGKRLFAQSTAESFGKAKEQFQEALQVWRALKDSDAEAQTLHEIAVIEYRGGNLKLAAEHLTHAIKLFRDRQNKRGEASSITELSNVYNFSGEPQKALDNYNEALVLARSIKDPLSEAQILSGLGLVLNRLGQTQKALETLNELIVMSRAKGIIDGEASGHHNIGFIYIGQGRLREAIQEYSQTLSLLQRSQDRFGQAATTNNIGSAHARMGEFQQALGFLHQGLRLRRMLGDRLGEAVSLGSIGFLYLRLADYSRAIQFYEQSLQLSRTIASRDNEAIALLNLGTIYGRTQEFQKALDHANQALLLVVQLKDRNGEANVLTTLGSIHSKLGSLPKALEYHEKALAIRRASENKFGESYTLSALGTVYAQMGNQQRALEYLNQALALSRSVSDKYGEVAIRHELARLERDRGNLSEARVQIEPALEIVESARSKLSLADVRANYFASRQDYYDFYIDLLMRLYKTEEKQTHLADALFANERRSARNLLDSLAEARADIRAGVGSELIDRERRLQQDLNAKADQQARLLNRKHSAEQAATVAKDLDVLNSELEEVQTQIRQSSPRYAALTQPQPLQATDIQKLLDPDTVLLEYALGEERSFVWAITPTSLKGFELPGRATIEAAAERFNKVITENQNRNVPLQVEAGAALSRLVLAPVARELGQKKIVVVGDGALLRVPFSALPIPTIDNPRRAGRTSANRPYQPLILKHEIVLLPSASVLAVVRRETASRAMADRLVAVIADPVFQSNDPRVRIVGSATNGKALSESKERPAWESGLENLERLTYSRREADAIVNLVAHNQSFKAVDFAANRAAVSNDVLSRYRVVHFATHAMLNNANPELSGIVVSLVDENGKPQNGFVRLHEIYNLRLSADLVVLSACRTALGKQVRGEGLIGLTRGFMYAGSPRVVVSLWEVNDEATAELMKKFYTAMFVKGMRPAAALRTAQISMSRSRWWNAPYYWAAFELQGEIR